MKPRFKPDLSWIEIKALFKSNSYAVEKFEKEFARIFEAKQAVAFPYGRSAQWAFFNAVGIKNSEIIVPSYTCSVVAHSISLSGNIPRFIDINLNDYNMNLDQAEEAINKNTKAIIATHTFGYPQDLDRLEAIIKNASNKYGHKIWLMQDCCHAFGADWNGRMIGASGDVAVYAFNISKIITSIFGGMLTFMDDGLADKVRYWRDTHYKSAKFSKAFQRRLYLLGAWIAFNEKVYGATWWLKEKTTLLNRFTKSYHLDDKIHFPSDYLDKMLNVEAVVGIEQLKKYPSIINLRRSKARFYNDNLPQIKGWRFPPIVKGATYSHYTVRVPDRKKVISEYNSKGIELGELIQYNIPDLQCYKKNYVNCYNSRLASKTTVNFPVC